MNDGITNDWLNNVEKEFQKSPHLQVAQNILTATDLRKATLNYDRWRVSNHNFSHTVPGEQTVTHQKRSGRCWLFAALNMLRIEFSKKFKLSNFEFSQNYLFFWDKLEKANYFLETVLKTRDEEADSRLIMFLMKNPTEDGGQWDMFCNLVEKYGLVPQSVYPDTEACKSSHNMNYILDKKLRENAATLRKEAHKGKSLAQLKKQKMQMMKEIYHMLTTQLGSVVHKFDWSFHDKDNKFHIHKNLTPKKFAKTLVKPQLNQYVCLVHSPRKKTPYYSHLTIKYLNNVSEGNPVSYINVPIEEMKKSAISMLKAKKPVWFGCDVGKSFSRDLGLMDANLYDYDVLWDIPFKSTKEERMNYGHSMMTHAMLFTGVDLHNNKPIKWKVENSWGDSFGNKGYMMMTDDWFNEYMFEIAVDKKYVSAKALNALKQDPIELPPWDPMGALA